LLRLELLLYQHKNGARLCSVCAGAFILAETGLLKGRPATTHWGLAYDLQKQFPDAIINSERILINDGDIVTAGGITAWIDLSLELVALFAGPAIMRLMGKQLIFDTGHREQRYYQSFSPSFSHGDSIMIAAQNFIHENYFHQVNIKEIAESICLSEKTLLRRFKKATGMVPINYLQRVRIQKACDFLENSDDSFETICDKVGYVDVSSFRKIFIKTMGLTPREFRKRFAYQSHEIDNSL